MPSPNSEKMVAVVDALRQNTDVEILGGLEENYLRTGEIPRPNGYWSRTLDIYTYPTEPIYSADELNELMFSLTPNVDPSMSDRFRDSERELSLGKLYYDETIGTMSTVAVTTSVDLNPGLSVVEADILEGEWTVSDDPKVVNLQQRTWIRLFPDGGHAADAAEEINEYKIPRGQLGESGGRRLVPRLLESNLTGRIIEATAAEIKGEIS